MLLHSSSSAARRGLGSSPQLAPEKRTLPRSTVRRTLRFGVGERAECKTGKTEWSAGEVIVLMFHAHDDSSCHYE